MAAEVQQGLDHLQVAFIYSYVQWSLSSLVPCVQVGPAPLQHLNDGALVAKGRMVHCTVSIFVLDTEHTGIIRENSACVVVFPSCPDTCGS